VRAPGGWLVSAAASLSSTSRPVAGLATAEPSRTLSLVLVDTSVWVDHLRRGDPALAALLEAARVLCHPAIIGEIALGTLRDPGLIDLLSELPGASVATDTEVLALVRGHGLAGTGIGWVDAQLLAATLLTPGARLWTRDRRLAAASLRLGIAHPEE
jgi:hypothetical protein